MDRKPDWNVFLNMARTRPRGASGVDGGGRGKCGWRRSDCSTHDAIRYEQDVSQAGLSLLCVAARDDCGWAWVSGSPSVCMRAGWSDRVREDGCVASVAVLSASVCTAAGYSTSCCRVLLCCSSSCATAHLISHLSAV